MKRNFFVFFMLFVFSVNAFAVSVTIYNNDLALIKDRKEVKLKKGLQKIEVDNIAMYIDPSSVLPKFSSHNDKIKINEQNSEPVRIISS